MTTMTIVWLAAAVILGIAEAATTLLTCIWFALGAVAAMIVALFGGALWLQILVFAAVSLVTLLALRPLAKELGVVLPVSFYEKDGLSLYNTVAVIDADGSILGVYRKTHIPDDHFYQEKFYFTGACDSR